MRQSQSLVGLLFLLATFSSCKKDENSKTNCFADAITSRKITDKQAGIELAGGQYYILEEGTIDTKLNPCNLEQAFQVDNLKVIISGDVKSTIQSGFAPCCIENFVITKITR